MQNTVDRAIRLSKVQKKSGAELVYNSIVGRNFGRHLLFCSETPPHNAISDEFDTSLSLWTSERRTTTVHNKTYASLRKEFPQISLHAFY